MSVPLPPDGSFIAAIGIDVAKATLSVCLRSPHGSAHALTFRNTEADIRRKLFPHLHGFTGRIVMESTNHYHWRVALLLSQAGYDVRVVNPILARQYTSANIRKVKTDPADAEGLARMADIADNLPARFVLSQETLGLRKKLSSIAAIGRQLQSLKGTLRQLEESHEILGTEASPGEEALQSVVRELKQTQDVLEQEFVQEAERQESDPDLSQALDTIPGVTPFVAHLVLHWFSRFPGGDAKSWIGYAGLDISSRESGTWKGRCRLTKRGNSFLRRRLYSAAWGATMVEGPFKAYYARLRSEGRPHVESLLIIARKIIRIMFKIVETGESYDPAKCVFGQPVPLLAA